MGVGLAGLDFQSLRNARSAISKKSDLVGVITSGRFIRACPAMPHPAYPTSSQDRQFSALNRLPAGARAIRLPTLPGTNLLLVNTPVPPDHHDPCVPQIQ